MCKCKNKSVLILAMVTFSLFLSGENLGFSAKDSINSPNLNELPNSMVHLPDAHKITNGSRKVVLAVIDSGLDYRFPQLQQSLWVNKDEIANNGIDDDGNGYIDDVNGFDFVDNDNDIMDEHGHGTLIVSQLVGFTDSSIENMVIDGISPNISIMVLRFLNSKGKGTGEANFVRAMDYAIQNGAAIISLSFTWDNPPAGVYHALEFADTNQVLVVGASGNYPYTYPIGHITDIAKSSFLLSVGSVNSKGIRSIFSQYGRNLDLMAPGENIRGLSLINSTDNTYSIKKNSGTSFAVPYVSGTAALVLSLRPFLTLAKLENILLRSATDILEDRYDEDKNNVGWDEYNGFGLLNAAKAVSSVLDYTPPNVTINHTVGIDGFSIAFNATDNTNVYQLSYSIQTTDTLISTKHTYQGGINNISINEFIPLSNSNYSFKIVVEDIIGNKLKIIASDNFNFTDVNTTVVSDTEVSENELFTLSELFTSTSEVSNAQTTPLLVDIMFLVPIILIIRFRRKLRK